jgi:hypothetical protein
MLDFKTSLASAILTFVFTGGMASAQTDIPLEEVTPESNNNTENNTVSSNSGVVQDEETESNNNTEDNTVSSNSGLEQMTIKAYGQGQSVEEFNAKTIDTCIVEKLSNFVMIMPKCGEYYTQAINKMLLENFTIKAVDNTGVVFMEKIK